MGNCGNIFLIRGSEIVSIYSHNCYDYGTSICTQRVDTTQICRYKIGERYVCCIQKRRTLLVAAIIVLLISFMQDTYWLPFKFVKKNLMERHWMEGFFTEKNNQYWA